MAKSNVKTTKKSTAKKATAKTTKTTAKKSNLNAATQKKAAKKTTTPTKKTTTKSAATKQQNFILRKDGLDKEGNQKFTAIRVYNRKPNGWKDVLGATTAPVGYKWIHNGQSVFAKDPKTGERKYKQALLKLKDK